MSGFDVFENRWTISGVFELETPLHIGGGQNAVAYSISAAPILQTYNMQTQIYESYIPGSSLKGLLRSTVERLIRTFDKEKSCIAIKNYNGEKSLCDDCITCRIFGSMKTGAKIRVRDSHLSDNSKGFYGSVKELPHCATRYIIHDGKFEIKTKSKFIGKKKINIASTSMRMEEIVIPGLCFDIQIDMDNANTKEIGLVLLALQEFDKKRINLGGGGSRGNGFAKINNISVRKKSIDDRFQISELSCNANELMKEGKKYLKAIDSGRDIERRDFDIYYKAHSEERKSEGHIVALLRIITLTDFIMPGAEEETVTCGGIPIIPGSTIKGYFRHKLIEKGISADTIKDIFGYENYHRGRLLVSDAYNDTITDPKKIPSGSILKMWLVFDNMTKEEINLIDNIIKIGKNTITGKTSSKWDTTTELAKYNTVRMEFESIDIFNVHDYIKGA